MTKCEYEKEKTYECEHNPKQDPDSNCPWWRSDLVDYAVCTNPYRENG